MRLKSLEIKGFKSFADKTVINLDNQITGIVGPNGCGKSNIVDAIRWVIGEHKIKTLRSDNLEDLVFNGSKSRNSSGLAEVSLTFENTKNLLPTEYNMVTISRKFYKNGESEYRLNDVSCRLKDITNLFMDTGVTSDSYSIIELGMVDDIIKDKEGSRRRMLEQAAGISIYKTRKKEAKNKLDLTELDLNRIEDLLFEISNNLRTLETQSKKAEKYLQIKSEYKEVSVELVKASLEDFNVTYQSLNTQQQQEVDKIFELDAVVNKEGAEIEMLKLDLLKREEELHTLQKAFNELKDKLRNTENHKNLSAQQIQHLEQLCNTIKHTLAESEKQKLQLEKNTSDAEKKIETESETLQSFKVKLEQLRTELDEKRAVYDAQKANLDVLRNEHQSLQVKQFEAEKVIAIADNTISNINRSVHQLQDEQTSKASEIQSIQQSKDINSQTLETKNAELVEMLKRQEEATQKLFTSQAELETLRVALFDENRKLDAKQNEFNLLKSLVDSLDGYPDSIKFLNKNASWNFDALLLSETFNVKDEYRTCIENYLDRYLNYYVVDNAAQAYSAVHLLQQHNKGKAGFFMLNEISKETGIGNVPEDCIKATDVITCTDRYATLIHHLLKNVYIANNLDAKASGQEVLLQKDGSSYKTSKRIVGGSVGVFEGNKIGRVQRLEKLKEEIASLTQEASTFKTKITDTQNLIVGFNQQIKDNEINKTKEEINKLENGIIQANHKLENIQAQQLQNKERLTQLNNQLLQTKEGITSTQISFSDTKNQLSLAFNQLSESQQKFGIAEASYNKANEDYNQHNIIITRQQSRINEIMNERVIREQQIKDLIDKIAQDQIKLADTNKQLETSNAQLASLADTIHTLLQEKEVAGKKVNEKDQQYYNFRNTIAEKESTTNAKRKEKEQSETLLNTIKDKLTDMKLHLASMKERLNVEFKINIDEVLKEPRKNEMSLDDLNNDVDKLKKRLENLGEVNPMAVDAYKEVKARHDFIIEQKQDLVTAKESLLKTIEEVELTANAKFKDTFEKVRENFIAVFHALFTSDDTCDMKLTDPENLAETSIEIYAQPKGKKPSTITQLSGGEKTLTSTAFLFAIYLIKPAPFCVLDEVDAPLDDANVGKFAKMIREFSNNSQFIIVTHNKQTMASVDVIYGVTMQEAGVSKLVPVDFRSLN